MASTIAPPPPPSIRPGFESPDHFSELVAPHLPCLHRAAREILGQDDLAWDAVQETLLRVWLRGWLPPEPAAALVHLVSRSSLHLARCLRRRRYHETKATELFVEPCCDDDPLSALEAGERGRALREALNAIPAEYRSIYELFEVEGESYEAIAGRLSLPIGTVRSRLSRARSKLRQRLEDRFSAA